ncbi:PaaI family thioesterase [Novosphingobium aquimarinum]|uniref:PaaI family thioesterase n=1 Tax=Novosphingobium aquimarinum TaxID=2682494 RepID=UPI0012EC4496|nr:PaaI family thioesterase [Novosphingobium aquimarinum]
MAATAALVQTPDPDNPGWTTWDIDDQSRFNPQVMRRLIVRAEGEHGARMRLVEPKALHANLQGTLHGGVTLALVDIAMFATLYIVSGDDAEGSVTLDLNCQFIGTGSLDKPVDVVSEVLRETRRLAFVRGIVEQGDTLVASYSGTLRKPSRQ